MRTMKIRVGLRVMMRRILNLRVKIPVCQSDQSDDPVCAWEASDWLEY